MEYFPILALVPANWIIYVLPSGAPVNQMTGVIVAASLMARAMITHQMFDVLRHLQPYFLQEKGFLHVHSVEDPQELLQALLQQVVHRHFLIAMPL